MIQNILAGQKLTPEQMGQMQQPMAIPQMMPQMQQPMKLDPYGQQVGNLRQILMGAMR